MYVHNLRLRPSCIHTVMCLTLKLSVTDTRVFMWVCGWRDFVIKLFLLNLIQILYLVGVGLILTFDLLACVDSQGMLYPNPSSVKVYYQGGTYSISACMFRRILYPV